MKNVLFALMAIVVAASASAFTISQKAAEGDIYVNVSSDDYQRLVGTFNEDFCIETTDHLCAYVETEEGDGLVPASFDATQAAVYLANGWIEPRSTTNGIYDPQ